MSGARVLVIDSEPREQRQLRSVLAKRGFEVLGARDGEEALATADRRPPDVILLDLELSGMSGLQVCWSVRRWSSVPIIALSTRKAEQDKVLALHVGADDYLTKPFGFEELTARIRVALRHSAGAGNRAEAVLGDGDLRMDYQTRQLWRGATLIALTPKEYDLLKYLVQHPDRLIHHDDLLRGVWGAKHMGKRQYLRTFVPQLRQKIESDPAHPRYILTERGVGYRFRS